MDELQKKIAICLQVYKLCILARVTDDTVLLVNPSLLNSLSLEDIAVNLSDGSISEKDLLLAMESIDYARTHSTSFPKASVAPETPSREDDD